MSKTKPYDACLLILYLALAFVLGIRQIGNEDIWWHLKAGQWILQHHRVPRVDPFTFGAANHPWIDLHWLFQVVLYFAFEKLGPIATTLFQTTFVVGLAIALIRLRRPGQSPRGTIALATLALLAVQYRITARPELVSCLFLAVTLGAIERFHATGKRWFLAALVPLQIVWVNVHSLYVLGLAIIWMYILGEELRLLLARTGRFGPLLPGPETPRAARLLRWGAGFLATLACLANPYGFAAFSLPLTLYRKTTGGHDIFSSTIGEFFPLWHPMYRPWLPVFTVLLVGVTVWALFRSRREVRIHRILWVAAFLWLALRASRNVSLFAIVSMTVAIGSLGESRSEGQMGQVSPSRRRGVPGALALSLCLFACIWAMCTNRLPLWISGESFGLGFDPEAYIGEASAFVGREDLGGNALVVPIGRASRFIWDHAPARKVVMDNRLEVAGPDLFAAQMRLSERIARGETEATQELDRLEVRYVIVDHRWFAAEEGLLTTGDWALVHFDPVASVYLRKGWPGNLEALRRNLLGWPDRLFQRRSTEPWLLEALERDRGRFAWLGPVPGESSASLEAHACLKFHTYLARAGGQADPAAVLAARAARLERSRVPDSPHSLFLLASAYRRLAPNESPGERVLSWPPFATFRYSQTLAIARIGLRENSSDIRGLFAAYLAANKLGLKDLSLAYLEALSSWRLRTPLSGEEPIEIARRLLPRARIEVEHARQLGGEPTAPGAAAGDPVRDATRLLVLGLSTEARKALEKRTEETLDPGSLLDAQARLSLLLGEPEVATAIWEASGSFLGADDLEERLATAALARGDLGAALRRLEDLAERAPDRFWTHWLLAMIQTELGHRPEAVREWRSAMSAASEGPARVELERSLGWVTEPERPDPPHPGERGASGPSS